jgi:hypothetical protein
VSFEAKYAIERPNLVVGFLALFSFIAAAALRACWRAIFHNLLALIADIFDKGYPVIGHPFGFLADAFRKADSSVYNWLGRLKDSSGHAFVTAVMWVAMQIVMIAVAVAALSYELLRYAHLIGHRTSAPVIQKIVRPTQVIIKTRANKGVVAHDSRVPALEGEIDTLRTRLHAQQAEITKLQAIAVPYPYPLPQPKAPPAPTTVPRIHDVTLPRVGEIDKAVRGLRKQLHKWARYLTPAGIIGLVGAATFDQFGLGWLRCRGVGRVGRWLCGLSGLIETLAVGAITAFAVTDLCRFTRGIERTAEEIRPLMLQWVNVENALIGGCGGDAPLPLPVNGYNATPVVDQVAI